MHSELAGICSRARLVASRRAVRIGVFIVLTLAAGTMFQLGGDLIEPGLFSPNNPLPAPFAAVDATLLAVAVLALAIEALVLGWRDCSARQLISNSDHSTGTDAMYALIWLSGMMSVLTALMTLGLTLYLSDLLDKWTGLTLLTQAPLWVAVPIALLWQTFISYWEHRVAHSRLMWPLHKSHHSPTDFTVLTAFREHPIEVAIGGLTNSLALALLGLSPTALVVMQIFAGISPLFLHSKLYRLAWLERLGIGTPAGHRIHHSALREQFDKNFGGTLNIWDRLFGTYVRPYPGIGLLPIGVDDSATHHNNERPFRSILAQASLWLRALWRPAADPARL